MSNSANNDPISQALGITSSLSTQSSAVQTIIMDAHNDSARNDFETARANILTIIDQGQESIVVLQEIARSSQNPRAFEVLAKLMDTIRDANKDLLALQEKIRELNAADQPQNNQAQKITNNLFVGSTAELQKMIKDMRDGPA